MAFLQVIYGNNPIFRQKCEKFDKIDQDAQDLANAMLDTMHREGSIIIAANMVGSLKRIFTLHRLENGLPKPLIAFNPEIIAKSAETQTYEEVSVSFPGVAINITRPKKITIKYLDLSGDTKEMESEGLQASIIQHAIDHLDGITMFDYVSKMKKDMLVKKMEKFIKLHPPHIHSSSCRH